MQASLVKCAYRVSCVSCRSCSNGFAQGTILPSWSAPQVLPKARRTRRFGKSVCSSGEGGLDEATLLAGFCFQFHKPSHYRHSSESSVVHQNWPRTIDLSNWSQVCFPITHAHTQCLHCCSGRAERKMLNLRCLRLRLGCFSSGLQVSPCSL